MYPKEASLQAEELNKEFSEKINSEIEERQKYLEEALVFTIDGPGTKAFDDAISI